MKRIIAFLLSILLVCCCFTGCKEVKHIEHLDDYVSTLEYRDGFTILQLTDIHWSTTTQMGSDEYGSKLYLQKLINQVIEHIPSHKIDLIELTGDTFMLSNQHVVNSFFDFIEGLDIPYAFTWGNHDREGKYNPNWLSEKCKNAKNSLYKEVDNDDVSGRCNYVINLNKDGETKWQIINIDSGASYRDGANDVKLTYDYIRDDQFDWLSAEHNKVGASVPALCYYHIPQKDNGLAYDNIEENGYKNKFFKLEGFGKSKYAVETFDIFAANNVKAAFMGHAHNVDWTVTVEKGSKEVTYGLGVKTGKELYYTSIDHTSPEAVSLGINEDIDLIGASLVTLNNDSGDYSIEHIYFNERENGDYVKWVVY